ncbi:DUF4870 domain-containing protein [Nocardioides coralli]|uniref:DUF4870 domain-containing protein n=1 Tax=Nocardioides coralli TaxID=2872154 RepID=UPI001CA454E8|nr:DUF4870 domain-containing protein [Nocardioides coralli]QZY30258.1 DUF4870 domain-containing protein [Nocardioides coralli]
MSDPHGQPPYGDPAHGPGDAVTQEAKNWALVSHIGTLVSAYIALGFLAPLLVMLIKGESPFVRRHAVESLNFQISVLIYAIAGTIVSVLLVVLTFGILAFVIVPIAVVLALVVLGLIILATVRAANGEDYRYPLTLRLVK